MRFIYFLIVIFLLTTVACVNNQETSDSVEVFTGARFVRTEVAVIGNIERVLNYSGFVRFDQAINIIPSMPGRIERIYVREGQNVAENQILARIDQNSLDQAEANFNLADRNYERAQSLLVDGAIDQRSFEEIEIMWKTAKNAFEFAKDNLEIRAPFAGVISSVNFRENETYTPMNPMGLFRIINNNSIYVEVNVSDADVRLLRLRQRANIKFDDVEIVGFVSFISPENDMMTGLNRVRVEFQGLNRQLRNNLFVHVEFIPEYRNDVLIIPRTALVADDMVVLKREGRSEYRRVRIGMENRGFVEVLEGLNAGDVVIVEGNSGLEDGYPVVEFGA